MDLGLGQPTVGKIPPLILLAPGSIGGERGAHLFYGPSTLARGTSALSTTEGEQQAAHGVS